MENKEVVIINLVTPKEGKFEEVVKHQLAAQDKFAGAVKGWRGTRLHRSVNDKKVAMITIFDSIELHQEWLKNPQFIEHRDELLGLVEAIEPAYYTIVRQVGEI